MLARNMHSKQVVAQTCEEFSVSERYAYDLIAAARKATAETVLGMDARGARDMLLTLYTSIIQGTMSEEVTVQQIMTAADKIANLMGLGNTGGKGNVIIGQLVDQSVNTKNVQNNLGLQASDMEQQYRTLSDDKRKQIRSLINQLTELVGTTEAEEGDGEGGRGTIPARVLPPSVERS